MKPRSGKTITANLDADGGLGVVRLREAEYGSFDAAKLARVRGLLLDQAEKPNPPYLVIDLSTVHFFGAGFIGILVTAWDRLRQRERRLVLRGLTPYCHRLILTLHLDRLFEIYPTHQITLQEIGQRADDSDGAAPGPGIRVQKSDVAWDPHMVRLEYVGEDDVPFRSIIVPRS